MAERAIKTIQVYYDKYTKIEKRTLERGQGPEGEDKVKRAVDGCAQSGRVSHDGDQTPI